MRERDPDSEALRPFCSSRCFFFHRLALLCPTFLCFPPPSDFSSFFFLFFFFANGVDEWVVPLSLISAPNNPREIRDPSHPSSVLALVSPCRPPPLSGSRPHLPTCQPVLRVSFSLTLCPRCGLSGSSWVLDVNSSFFWSDPRLHSPCNLPSMAFCCDPWASPGHRGMPDLG